MKTSLNTAIYLLIFFILSVLTACNGVTYYHAPTQKVPELEAESPSTLIRVINKAGGNVEFTRGPLEGLVLGHRESYIIRLPWGSQKHSWRQVVLHKDKVYRYSDNIVVTHRSKTLSIIPPKRDDMFYTRGRGCLDLNDY